MRSGNIRLIRIVCFVVLIAVVGIGMEAEGQVTLRRGNVGPDVVLVQHVLFQSGLLTSPPDGIFGSETLRAVERYQQRKNIKVDGVVGRNTWNHIKRDAAQHHKKGEVELVHWREAQHVYGNFQVIRITDVQTGLSFQARRYYGHHHADTEPLTAEDAAVIRKLYNGAGWERRPIIVEVDGRKIAASMNGMPHGQGAITDNGFPGHFCVHFLGSRIHAHGGIDPEHQKAVLRAAGYDIGDLWFRGR